MRLYAGIITRRLTVAAAGHRQWLCPTLALLLLVGCGGSPNVSSDSTAFNNHTAASQQQLYAMWQAAQQDLATNQIYLNPVPILLGQNVSPQYVPPDSRALGVQPNGLQVVAVSDVNGSIDCGHTLKCHSYVSGDTVYVAASLVLAQGATGWEFENVILQRLDYDVSGR